jgi:hypothetical protein
VDADADVAGGGSKGSLDQAELMSVMAELGLAKGGGAVGGRAGVTATTAAPTKKKKKKAKLAANGTAKDGVGGDGTTIDVTIKKVSPCDGPLALGALAQSKCLCQRVPNHFHCVCACVRACVCACVRVRARACVCVRRCGQNVVRRHAKHNFYMVLDPVGAFIGPRFLVPPSQSNCARESLIFARD